MWSTDSIHLVFLATGFSVGFGHCLGMCGPIVISVSLQLKDRPSLWPQVWYNVGRTLTYGILGAVMGATASFTRFAAEVSGLQQSIMVLAGLLIAIMGLAMTGWLPAGKIFHNAPPLQRWVSKAFKRLIPAQRTFPFLFLGLVLGLLPCGPVYTAMLAAARVGMEAGSSLQGAASGFLLMACFGAGTIPALLLLSRVTHVKWLKHRQMIYRVGGLAMVGVGIYFMWKGIVY